MVSLKTLKPHLFYTLLKHQKPSLLTQTHEFISGIDPILHSSLPQRRFFTNTQLISPEVRFESTEMKGKKSLDVLFKEAVGLSEKLGEESEISEDELNEEEGLSILMSKLSKIEGEVRSMKGNLKDIEKKKEALKKEDSVLMVESKADGLKDRDKKKKALKKEDSVLMVESKADGLKDRDKKKKALKKEESVLMVESKVDGLYSMFTSKPITSHSLFTKSSDCKEKSDVSEKDQGESSMGLNLMPMKELQPEMILFTKHLHEKGYLRDANFLLPNKLDFSCFSTFYSRGYLRSAAERFGKDHQDKAKFLSESDVKRLALFGCPSVEKKTAFAAKRLRSYFSIQEDIVCRPCKLNSSCKSKNHTVGKKANDLDLADVMKILTLYALELVPCQLTIPAEIQDSVSRLLKQVLEHFH